MLCVLRKARAWSMAEARGVRLHVGNLRVHVRPMCAVRMRTDLPLVKKLRL